MVCGIDIACSDMAMRGLVADLVAARQPRERRVMNVKRDHAKIFPLLLPHPPPPS